MWITLAILLAFSRAAWGGLVITAAFMLALMVLTSNSHRQRSRIIVMALVAVVLAAMLVAIMLSLVAPYTAEEMWERLGHEPTVALAGWPSDAGALTAIEELGKNVFFDTNLSRPRGKQACASCHDPARGWVLPLAGPQASAAFDRLDWHLWFLASLILMMAAAPWLVCSSIWFGSTP